jgi:transcriptional regulator with XRE-family HTH domain
MDNTLGAFLRSRRARVKPEEVGLPGHGRRQVPGLRREEVAQLAGVSVDSYARLEQGRGGHVSGEVLDAVARVLRLDAADRARLHDLAGPDRRRPAPRSARSSERVRSGVRLLLDSMTDFPAVVVGRRMDVLAWNALGDAMHAITARRGVMSLPRRVFLDPDARSFYPEWPAVAAETVGCLRLLADRHPDDGPMTDLVGELSVKSEDFRRLWAGHAKKKTHGVKRISHPVAGELHLAYETLALPDDPGQSLITYTAPPGSETAERLAVLASWTASDRTGTPSGER